MAIEIRVESHASGGLRLIGHLPSIRPCLLEGKNGVGKSALIRVLTLASGQQPFMSDPGAWRSLKRLIGPTQVVIDGMDGPSAAARLVLTPDEWPDEPTSQIGEWLGKLELDGSPAPVADLFGAFDVVHVAGTERLVDTLHQRKEGLVASIRETRRRLGLIEEQRAEFGEIAEQLNRVSPRRAEDDRVASEAATRELAEIADDLGAASKRLNDLSEASGLRALLDAGKSSGAEVELRLVRAKIEAARLQLAESERAHEFAVEALTKGTQAQKNAAKLERQLSAVSKKLDSLAARQEWLSDRLGEVGLDPGLDTLDDPASSALATALTAARLSQREAIREAARARRTYEENQVLDELRVVLDAALDRGLGELLVAVLDGVHATVGKLSSSLGVVEGDGDHSGNYANANSRVAELTELQAIFAERGAARTSARKADEELGSLGTKIAGHDELRDAAKLARANLDEASARLRSLNMQLGAMSRAGLSGADAEDAEQRFAELLGLHGVPVFELNQYIASSQIEHAKLSQRDEALATQIRELGDRAVRRRVDREALKRRWLNHPEFGWVGTLADSFGADQGCEAGKEDWSDVTWQRLADHVESVKSATTELVQRIEGLESVGSSHGQAGPLVDALDAVVERDAVDLLSAQPIADALFDGGEISRVNLEEESITWHTGAGEVRTRPLSVFSSGEQAFGFMRARLQQVAVTREANRVVFLDEFGAFIAADRRRSLANLLTTDQLKELRNQVFVVLPLQADYEAELAETTGDLHDLFESRARSIREIGYFTEVFAG